MFRTIGRGTGQLADVPHLEAVERSAAHAFLQGAAQSTTTAIQAIAGKIGKINQVSTAVAAAVQEQSAATGEISNNVQQAAIGTQEISKNITGVAEAANQTGAAASTFLTVAEQLASQAENLNAEVGKFITALNHA